MKQARGFLCFYNHLLLWVEFLNFSQNNIYLILEFEMYITNKSPEEVKIDLTVVFDVN